MKTLKEALFSKKNLDNKHNKYNITERDMKGNLAGFPVGVVVRMMEEQEKQGNKPNVIVFQKNSIAGRSLLGFNWDRTIEDKNFWKNVIFEKDFDLFFKRYPEYEKYNW